MSRPLKPSGSLRFLCRQGFGTYYIDAVNRVFRHTSKGYTFRCDSPMQLFYEIASAALIDNMQLSTHGEREYEKFYLQFREIFKQPSLRDVVSKPVSHQAGLSEQEAYRQSRDPDTLRRFHEPSI